MNRELDIFFDDLQRKLDYLNYKKERDNENQRHNNIIYPLLTSPLTFGWDSTEIITQLVTDVPKEVINSYFWKGSVPKKRKPDMIIMPESSEKTVAVIEEKKAQADLETLRKYLGQLHEYQYLHNAVWGLLTDGEKWILKRNFEVFYTFKSLLEVKKYLKDLQECIGKKAVLERLTKFGTVDLVIAKQPLIIISINLSTKLSNSSKSENNNEYKNNNEYNNNEYIVCVDDGENIHFYSSSYAIAKKLWKGGYVGIGSGDSNEEAYANMLEMRRRPKMK